MGIALLAYYERLKQFQIIPLQYISIAKKDVYKFPICFFRMRGKEDMRRKTVERKASHRPLVTARGCQAVSRGAAVQATEERIEESAFNFVPRKKMKMKESINLFDPIGGQEESVTGNEWKQ